MKNLINKQKSNVYSVLDGQKHKKTKCIYMYKKKSIEFNKQQAFFK